MNILILTLLITLNIFVYICVRAIDIRQMSLYNRRMLEYTQYPVTNLGPYPLTQKRCFVNNILTRCPNSNYHVRNIRNNALNNIERKLDERHRVHQERHFGKAGESAANSDSLEEDTSSNNRILSTSRLHHKLDRPLHQYHRQRIAEKIALHKMRHKSSSFTSSQEVEPTTKYSTTTVPTSTTVETTVSPVQFNFANSLDEFERKFYLTTFGKLTAISPPSRRENGISYVQSGLFLQLALMTFLNEIDPEANSEIVQCLAFNISDEERIQTINETINSLPVSNDNLKFRWSTRLVMRDPQADTLGQQFKLVAAPASRLIMERFNGTETALDIAEALNEMVEDDSGGAIHDTFEEDDFAEGFHGILLNTLYFRARWRSSATLLNGTRRFIDSGSAPQRTVRMIRINDVMGYADLTDWDAQALEIFYSTPGLSLLMVVPRGNSLRSLVEHAANTSVKDILDKMWPQRIAVTLPLYTLRMTLLLPNKLEAMGVTHLLEPKNTSQSGLFRLSHAVQRVMFWAEAGRNAFKDDGLEWDEAPNLEVMVDRPYIFYVRWKNKTLLNGNFVL